MRKINQVLCLIWTVLLLAMPVQAAENSITVNHGLDGKSITGAEFRLYRVGTADGGVVTFDPALGISGDHWENMAQTVYAAVVGAGWTPCASGITDENGIAFFGALENGVYLLVGVPHMVDGKICQPEAYLFQLPGRDADGSATSNVTVRPKYNLSQDPIRSYRVMVLWDDDRTNRPASVEVALFKNGNLYETVTVSAENDWQYSWQAEHIEDLWTVSEKVPEGYQAAIQCDGSTFLITNSLKATAPDTPTEPQLPQTGQLWWPVPVMAATGMLLFLVGWKRRKESADA